MSAPLPADLHPTVPGAVAALVEYAGEDLTRSAAREILRHWRHFHELGPHEVVAILKAFPGKGDPGTRAHAEPRVIAASRPMNSGGE
jgi:hypothetical protein